MKYSSEDIKEALKAVVDPELYENIVDLGLIYDVRLDSDKAVSVDMTLTTPFCPMAPQIQQEIESTIRGLGYEEVTINLVWTPAWDPSTMASDEIKDKLGLW